MDTARADLPLAELEAQITALCANINAAQCRLLQLIGEFDRREGWGGWGVKSCAHWLNWRCGIALGAAREKVRVARALPGLPKIRAAFAGGELSFSKVRALTRVATAANEDYLMMLARHGTAAHVEQVVRAYRSVQREEERRRANGQHERRECRRYFDDDGSMVLKLRLPAEAGAVVWQAIEAGRERLASIVEDVSAETYSAQRAAALVAMAETFLTSGEGAVASADRYQVVVHVDEDVLKAPGGAGRSELEDGPWLAADTVRRLACDAGVVRMVDDADGAPLSVGRKTRSIPPAIRRALAARDRGCRFPGCTQHRYVDGHHIEHWVDGGETRLDNLVLLCRRHHRLVHEGGYGLAVGPGGRLAFSRPDGRPIAAVPPSQRATRDLAAANRARGLAIDADTGRCLWQGERLDLALAVDGLVQSPGY